MVFQPHIDFWGFAIKVLKHNRYFLSEESREFLDALLATSTSRNHLLLKNTELWRAQLGCEWTKPDDNHQIPEPCSYNQERMKPLSRKVGDGRANPRRIAYLYTATDVDTAIAEIRPWISSFVSVGLFSTERDLHLVDCSCDYPTLETQLQSRVLTADERECEVWADVNYAFSRPINQNKDDADYIPTQVIAEWFKVNGFDGIIYRSSLGPGKNCCLFDTRTANLESCHVYRVSKVAYSFYKLLIDTPGA